MVEMIRGAAPADGSWFAGGVVLGPDDQIAVYREQFRMRMWDALVDDVAGLHHLLGAPAYHDAEDDHPYWRYLADHPPDSWTLARIADHLADWLAKDGAPAEQVEMARLDAAVQHGFTAADGHTPRPEELQAVLGGADLRLALQPHVRLLRFTRGVQRVRSALLSGAEVPALVEGDFRLAVFRVERQMRHLECEPGEWALLDAFSAGADLGGALEAALAETGDAAVLGQRLGAWFQRFTERGLLQIA